MSPADKNQRRSVPQTPPADELPIIQQRFALRRRMASTALLDVYWASDLPSISPGTPERLVLVLLVNPSIAALPGFVGSWEQLLARPAPASGAYPDIIAWGEDKGTYWLACDNTKGILLSEYLSTEVDERGLPVEQAIQMVTHLTETLNGVQAGAFGYLEPGTVMRNDHGSYTILSAPLVKIMHQLLSRQQDTRPVLALHSSWISPPVAVGDKPVPEDDTFSIASLLHTLLTSAPPYGQHSTLSAVARGDAPASNRKLKAEAQQLLGAALSLQRQTRPETPEDFLTALAKKNKRKIIFPLALLAALGIIGYASHHLLGKVGELFNIPSNQQQAELIQPEKILTTEPTTQQPAPAPAALPDLALVDESRNTGVPTPAVSDATPTATPDPVPITDTPSATPDTSAITSASVPNAETPQEPVPADTKAAEVTHLILQATDAFNQGNADNTLALLRQAQSIDRDNPNIDALLSKVLEKRQQQTESHIGQHRMDDAKQALAATDNLMREFGSTSRIEEQVRLESLIEIRENEQKAATALLQQAQNAIKRGRLGGESGEDNALAHLNKLLYMLPNDKEGRELLAQVIGKRHNSIQKHISRNELRKAETHLAETERLIRKYGIGGLKAEQTALEQAWQQANQVNEQAATASLDQAPLAQEEPAVRVRNEQVEFVNEQPEQQTVQQPSTQLGVIMVEGQPPIQAAAPRQQRQPAAQNATVQGHPPIQATQQDQLEVIEQEQTPELPEQQAEGVEEAVIIQGQPAQFALPPDLAGEETVTVTPVDAPLAQQPELVEQLAQPELEQQPSPRPRVQQTAPQRQPNNAQQQRPQASRPVRQQPAPAAPAQQQQESQPDPELIEVPAQEILPPTDVPNVAPELLPADPFQQQALPELAPPEVLDGEAEDTEELPPGTQ